MDDRASAGEEELLMTLVCGGDGEAFRGGKGSSEGRRHRTARGKTIEQSSSSRLGTKKLFLVVVAQALLFCEFVRPGRGDFAMIGAKQDMQACCSGWMGDLVHLALSH